MHSHYLHSRPRPSPHLALVALAMSCDMLGFFWAVLIEASTYPFPFFVRSIIHHCPASQCIRRPSLRLSLDYALLASARPLPHPDWLAWSLIKSPSPVCRSRCHPSAATHETAARDEAATQHTAKHGQPGDRATEHLQSGEWVAACWGCGSTNPRFDIACGTEVHSARSAPCSSNQKCGSHT